VYCNKKKEKTDKLEKLEKWIKEQSMLQECWKWKPLYNGKQIMEEFPVFQKKENLKYLGVMLDELLQMRLSDPTIDQKSAKIFLDQKITSVCNSFNKTNI